MAKERQTNIELCRIFCMIYIVIYHLFIHNPAVTSSYPYSTALTTIFSLGVPVFIIISGYFGIHRSVKGILNLISQILFYSIIATLICIYFYKEPVTRAQWLSVAFPISKTQYWFVSTYVLLYILAPYVNKILDSFSKKSYAYYLLTLTVLVTYWGGVMKGDNCSDRSIITFIYLYSIGGFIRRYLDEIQINICQTCNKIKKIKFWQLYICVSIIFFILVTYLPYPCDKVINAFSNKYNSIGLTIFSILFFCSFRELKMQSTFINKIAKSSFAIYLIHGHSIVTYHRWLYNPYTKYGVTIDNGWTCLLYLLVIAFTIVISCILIDQIRILLFRYLAIDSIILSIDKKLNKIFK